MSVKRYWIDQCLGHARDAGNDNAVDKARDELEALVAERDRLRGQLAGMHGVLVACLLLVDEHSDCLSETLNRVMRDERRTKRAQAEITDNDELRVRIKDAMAAAQEQTR